MEGREADDAAQVLWDYMLMGHVLEPADVILVLGSNDTRVAEHAASLFHRGLAPLLLFSGNEGVLTRDLDQFRGRTEADVFAEVARQCGVPDDAIMRERESTNTGENVRFSHRLLSARGVAMQRIILVQKPFMERRSYATFMKQWPDAANVDLRVSSPPIAFRDYPNAVLTRDGVISVMVSGTAGGTRVSLSALRIRHYPEKGFQIAMDIPDHVWRAWERLVALGFNSHLMPKI